METRTRAIAIVLLGEGLLFGVGVPIWLAAGVADGTLRLSGALFGLLIVLGIVVVPLLGGGVHLLARDHRRRRRLARPIDGVLVANARRDGARPSSDAAN